MLTKLIKFLQTFEKKKRTRFALFIRNNHAITLKSGSYRCQCRRVATLIDEFEKVTHKEIYTDSFDGKTSEEYIHFLKSKGFVTTTVKNYQEKTKQLLNRAAREGHAVTNSLNTIKVHKEDTGAIYLTIDEINKLADLKLNKERAQVRDIFLIGCLTALRYSDYSRLTEDNFNELTVSIKTQKTNNRVVIPIHQIIHDIIKRNKGYTFLQYKKSKQNFNAIIKKICRQARINDKIIIERMEGFKNVKRSFKKWELVSSHTARRTGATNMYLAGIPLYRIMLITGHTTEQSFLLYLRIRREENAKDLQDHDFFKGFI